MRTWIALLRGINVGGHGSLAMRDLVALLQELGCEGVRTYVHSGNAVFRSTEADAARLAGRIAQAVLESQGFRPEVLVLGRAELERAVAHNPFPQADAEPRSLHLLFLVTPAQCPDLQALKRLAAKREAFVLDGRVLYLDAPDGIGRSKLAARAERLLGVPTTARNWRSITKLLELAEQTA